MQRDSLFSCGPPYFLANSATREISLTISRSTRVQVAVTVFEWKFVCGAYRLMEYHLDLNSCVYLLKSGAKNISLNFQMVSLSTKYLHTVSAGARI